MADDVVLSRRFDLPPNIVDARAESEADGAVYYDFPPAVYVEGEDEDFSDPIAAPASFSVISQTVRTTAAGTLVDVVLEIPDQDEVIDYEVRIAKVS